MADRQQASRRSSSGKRAAEQKHMTPPRRNDMIRCENCGEDYASSYPRCPFCDEGPARGPIHPIQVIALLISLVLIITALFIVFKKVGPLVFGDDRGPGSSVSTSQSTGGSTSADGSDSGSDVDVSQPDEPQIPVNSLILDKTDLTLTANEETQLKAIVDPAEAKVTWTSSHPDALTVDENGTIRNINGSSEKVKATITATAGDKTAQCTVYCKPGSTKPSGGDTGNNGGTTTPSGPVTSGSKGTIVNAGSGLNIRSGPGSSYDKVASGPNGAEVTILGEENGWYKIDYGGGKTGYVSKDFISVG